MFFDVGKAESALGATVPPKAPGGDSGQNRNLSEKQFGPKPPGEEAGAEGAGEAVGGAGEAAAGGAAVEELAPLLLLA